MSTINGNNPLRNRAHRHAWNVILFFNGAGSKPVMNSDTSRSILEDPAQALYQAAQKIKAEAVNDSGHRVDYASLAETQYYRQLRAITGGLSSCHLDELGDRNQRLAFWINLYNALILDAIICFGIDGRVPLRLFQQAAYEVCGRRFSADDIEHGVLRGNRPHPIYRLRPFAPDDPRRTTIIDPFDPRIHFALNCGARSCPPIAFYQGDVIDDQLELAAANFINGGAVEVDQARSEIKISPIFKWYRADFGGEGGVRQLLLKHLPAEVGDFLRGDQFKLSYADYDWTINQIVGG